MSKIEKRVGMVKVPESKIRHLKNKKYFEVDDLIKLFPKCWCFFIKGRKGIGKSYSLIKIFNEVCENQGWKVAYIRTRREDARSASASFEMNPEIPIYIKGGVIYSKENNEVKGRIFYANNLSEARSQYYNGYKYIIYDEYVEQNKSNYRNLDNFARNFCKFIMDVYRENEKQNLKVFCFGNDDIVYDPFTEYFGIDVVDTYFNYDYQNNILVGNLRNYYKGVLEDNKSIGLAYYDNILMEFLTNNKSNENIDQMLNYSKAENAIIEKYIYTNNKYIGFFRLLKEPETTALKICEKSVKGIPIWCFDDISEMDNKDHVKLEPITYLPFLMGLKNLIKNGKVKYLNSNTKIEVQYMLNKFYRGSSLKMLYGGK